MDAVGQLVLALVETNVLPQLDAEGTIYTLQGLQELEALGWQFIPPNDEQESNAS